MERWMVVVLVGGGLVGGCYSSRDDEVDARRLDGPAVIDAIDPGDAVSAIDAPAVPVDAAIDALVVVPCPPDYTRDEVTGSCYRFFPAGEPRGWLAAEALCELGESEGIRAHLVVIDDAVEGARVMAAAGATGLWLGLSDHAAEGGFRTVTGAPLAVPAWAAGQPDDAGGREDCAGIAAGAALWSDLRCDQALPVVCEHDSRRPATPPTYCDTDAPSDCGSCGDACGLGEPCVAQRCEPVCPSGYVLRSLEAGATCHKLVAAPATWHNAEANCEADRFQGIGAHLAVVESDAEREYLRTLTIGGIWIGASDHQTEGTFRWVTGAPTAFTDWAVNEPNDDFNTEDCVEYRAGPGLRNDRTCSQAQAYVCEWDRTPAATARTWCDTDQVSDCGACGNACPAGQACLGQYCQGACPPGYAGAIGSCYRVAAMPAQTWLESERLCEADVFQGIPAHLAVVGSVDERVWLDDHISGGFWIGLSDHRVEGTFRWVTGAPIGTFAQWGTGEPNNDFNREDCVEYRETTDRWNDRVCDAFAGWACEWDGVRPAAAPTWCDTDLPGNCGTCGRTCVPLVQVCEAQSCQLP